MLFAGRADMKEQMKGRPVSSWMWGGLTLPEALEKFVDAGGVGWGRALTNNMVYGRTSDICCRQKAWLLAECCGALKGSFWDVRDHTLR